MKPVVAEKKLPERRTSLVAIENVKLEIELDDEEPEEEEMVFGRVERTVYEPVAVEQPKVVVEAPSKKEEVVAVESKKIQSYSWDGTYAPVKEPREMEFEGGVWLMVCGEFVSPVSPFPFLALTSSIKLTLFLSFL